MKIKKRLSSAQIVILGFLFIVLTGSILLSLPISAADGKAVPYVDALFTATTATCVTGLVTVPTVSTWSVFGQAVILVLIQVGGLGVITIAAGIMVLLGKRIGVNNRILIQDSFSLNSLSGIVEFINKVIIGALVVEAIGALMYMTVFVPEFGLKGIWISVFNSVKESGYFILTDYFSLSEDEEVMHRQNLIVLKQDQGIEDNEFYHYDTPLTVEHEIEALLEAGFSSVKVLNNWGATYILKAIK